MSMQSDLIARAPAPAPVPRRAAGFVASFIPPVFFVRWIAPTVADVAALTAEFFRIHDAFGKRIVYVAIVPDACRAPDNSARLAMTRGRDEVLPRCEGMHIVMEGHGFRTAILRNAFATMQLFGKKRTQVQIHQTVQGALAQLVGRLPRELKFDPRSMLEKARTAGVLSPPTQGVV